MSSCSRTLSLPPPAVVSHMMHDDGPSADENDNDDRNIFTPIPLMIPTTRMARTMSDADLLNQQNGDDEHWSPRSPSRSPTSPPMSPPPLLLTRSYSEELASPVHALRSTTTNNNKRSFSAFIVGDDDRKEHDQHETSNKKKTKSDAALIILQQEEHEIHPSSFKALKRAGVGKAYYPLKRKDARVPSIIPEEPKTPPMSDAE